MMRRKTQPREFIDVLLERGRVTPSIPESVRARVLARARAELATAAPTEPTRAPVGRRRGLAIALAASAAFAVGAAAAAVALRGPSHQPPPAAPPPPSQAVQAPCSTPAPTPSAISSVAPQPSQEQKQQPVQHAPSAQESYAIELGILQRAQAAFGAGDFSNALLLVNDHARRFPNGRLTEEREALRVRALSGAGREKESAKAASAFRARFPRSPMLR